MSFYFVDLNIFALLPEVYLALLLFWMHQFQITIVSTWALVFVMCPFNATFQIYFYTSYVIMVSAYFYIMFKEFSWFTKCLIHRQIFKVGDKYKLLCKLKEKINLIIFEKIENNFSVALKMMDYKNQMGNSWLSIYLCIEKSWSENTQSASNLFSEFFL